MKTVFTDRSPVAHAWAHQTQSEARYRDNFSFRDRSLFSYSTVMGFRAERPNGTPVAFINADTYSVTTTRHMGAVWGATRGMERYAVAGLNELVRDGFAELADAWQAGRSATLARQVAAGDRLQAEWQAEGRDGDNYWRTNPAYNIKRARAAVAKWIGDNFAAIRKGADIAENWQARGESTARQVADVLAEVAGFTPRQVESMLTAAEKAAVKRKAAEDSAARARRLAEGRRVAELSDAEFVASFPADSSDKYGQHRQVEFGRNLARLHKTAKAAGLTSRTRELWRKLRAYREHLAGTDARIRAAYRADLARKLRAWRNGEGEAPSSYTFAHGRLTATHRRLVAAEAEAAERMQAARLADAMAAFAAWQAGDGARPSQYAFADGSAEKAAILADMDSRRVTFLAAFDAWKADPSRPRPAALATGDNRLEAMASADYATGRDLFSRASAANAEIAADVARCQAAERAERERQEAAERFAADAERRRAWLAGESDSMRDSYGRQLSDERGRALMRIKGANLETSWGADVPLSHAIRAFRFIKAVKESGRTWNRNGKTIRVGHYQVDSIAPDGSFVAGCHSFAWPEIERVAILAGVADMSADDSAVTPSAAAA